MGENKKLICLISMGSLSCDSYFPEITITDTLSTYSHSITLSHPSLFTPLHLTLHTLPLPLSHTLTLHISHTPPNSAKLISTEQEKDKLSIEVSRLGLQCQQLKSTQERVVEEHSKTLDRINDLWKQKWPGAYDEVEDGERD